MIHLAVVTLINDTLSARRHMKCAVSSLDADCLSRHHVNELPITRTAQPVLAQWVGIMSGIGSEQ